VNSLIRLFDRLIQAVIATAVGLMLVVICLQVFCRFVLNSALSWPEEGARFLMIWSMFLAAAYVQRERGHVCFRFFADRLPESVDLVLRIVMNLAVVAFLAVTVWGGVKESVMLSSMKTGALRISRSIPYLSVPVGAALMIVVTLRLIFDDIRTFRKK
jgi:TRAP-type C4-dicarboxylate transport system permease small subunit